SPLWAAAPSGSGLGWSLPHLQSKAWAARLPAGSSRPQPRPVPAQSAEKTSGGLRRTWFYSPFARSVQYRAREQAADSSVGRLLTRAVLYRCPNFTRPDLEQFSHRRTG